MTELLPPNLALPDDDLDVLWESIAAETAASPEDLAEAVAESTAGEPWKITDLGGAEWAMRHVADADQHIHEARMQADEWIDRITEWHRQQTAKHEAKRAFFAHHLERFMLEERERTRGKAKSLDLPSGKVATRKASPKVVVDDPEAFVAWVEAHGRFDWAPATRKPALKALKAETEPLEIVDEARLILDTGDIIPWCRVDYDGKTAEHMSGGACLVVGDPVGPSARVAEVDVLESRTVVQTDDDEHLIVPGVSVEPGGVTASVASIGGER